jgi:hemolysin activation/secretion protein
LDLENVNIYRGASQVLYKVLPMHSNPKTSLVTALLIAVGSSSAQAQAQATLDAGALQKQIEQGLKAAPASASQPAAKSPRTLTPAAAGAATIVVSRFAFEGNTLLSPEQLAEIVAPYQGAQYDLAQLRQIADIVADAYREAGWLVRVGLPKQEVKDGLVTLQITEARFGKVVVQGSQSRVDPAVLQAMVAAAQAPNEAVQTQRIDRALLLLDDIPGLNVAGNFAEGAQAGQTDLLLGVTDRPGVNGDVSLDNNGSRSTGAERVMANLRVNSPFGLGDQLQLTGLKSQGSDFERLAWTAPLGYDGLRAGVHATRLAYKLVGNFASLDSHGSATAGGLDLSYPWLRSQSSNVNLSASFDDKRFDNKANGASASHYGIQVWNLGLSASQFDAWQGGGANNFSALVSQGQVKLDGSANQAQDASGPATAGSFSKVRVGLSRLQTLTSDLSAYVALNVQRASKNLDSSERLYLGGAGGVRAYPTSEGGGSEGQTFTAELRQQLASDLTLTGFYDHGRVKAYKSNAYADGSGGLNSGATPNDFSLKGYGLSLAWNAAAGTELRATVARRMGTNPISSANGTDTDGTLKQTRLWLNATYSF